MIGLECGGGLQHTAHHHHEKAEGDDAEVERRARATSGVVGLRLYVEADNENAQRTYENLGMTASSYRFFARGFLAGT